MIAKAARVENIEINAGMIAAAECHLEETGSRMMSLATGRDGDPMRAKTKNANTVSPIRNRHAIETDDTGKAASSIDIDHGGVIGGKNLLGDVAIEDRGRDHRQDHLRDIVINPQNAVGILGQRGRLEAAVRGQKITSLVIVLQNLDAKPRRLGQHLTL